MSHAIACTQTGGNVLVECHGRGEFAEIVVRDNGAGISAETLPHVFDPLWQLSNARADGGRGAGAWLGLAVISRIVELHGGRVYAASDGLGMGATFTVRLPLACRLGAGKTPPQDEVVAGPFRSNGRILKNSQPSEGR